VKQSRRMSLIESVANVALGFGINFIANMTVLPLFGFAVTAGDALGIGIIFTAIAIARSFAVRRLFERFR
jgi:hypothetical protein